MPEQTEETAVSEVPKRRMKQTLGEILAEKGIGIRELARAVNVDPGHLCRKVKADREKGKLHFATAALARVISRMDTKAEALFLIGCGPDTDRAWDKELWDSLAQEVAEIEEEPDPDEEE